METSISKLWWKPDEIVRADREVPAPKTANVFGCARAHGQETVWSQGSEQEWETWISFLKHGAGSAEPALWAVQSHAPSAQTKYRGWPKKRRELQGGCSQPPKWLPCHQVALCAWPLHSGPCICKQVLPQTPHHRPLPQQLHHHTLGQSNCSSYFIQSQTVQLFLTATKLCRIQIRKWKLMTQWIQKQWTFWLLTTVYFPLGRERKLKDPSSLDTTLHK